MAELDKLIDDARQVHGQMQQTVKDGRGDVAREIVKLRSRFAAAISGILREMGSDSRLVADRVLAREFETHFSNVRQKLNEHQARYGLHAINKDKTGYNRSVEELAKVQEEFYSWAKRILG